MSDDPRQKEIAKVIRASIAWMEPQLYGSRADKLRYQALPEDIAPAIIDKLHEAGYVLRQPAGNPAVDVWTHEDAAQSRYQVKAIATLPQSMEIMGMEEMGMEMMIEFGPHASEQIMRKLAQNMAGEFERMMMDMFIANARRVSLIASS